MIIWYEDEPYFLEDYIQELREEGCFNIHMFDKADALLRFTSENIDKIDLFIIDLMVFGVGNTFTNVETDYGKLSGTALITKLETIYKNRHIEFGKKIVVFTNSSGELFYSTKDHPNIIITLSKIDILPSELLSIIKSSLNS